MTLHSSKPQPQVLPADQLERASQDLDVLIHDLRLGTRSQRDFDELEERASRIADAICAVFGSPIRLSPLPSSLDPVARLLAAQLQLDTLIGELRLGIVSPRAIDALDERACGIAHAIRAAFRSPSRQGAHP